MTVPCPDWFRWRLLVAVLAAVAAAFPELRYGLRDLRRRRHFGVAQGLERAPAFSLAPRQGV